MSSDLASVSSENLYSKPEQPPESTKIRKRLLGLADLSSFRR